MVPAGIRDWDQGLGSILELEDRIVLQKVPSRQLRKVWLRGSAWAIKLGILLCWRGCWAKLPALWSLPCPGTVAGPHGDLGSRVCPAAIAIHPEHPSPPWLCPCPLPILGTGLEGGCGKVPALPSPWRMVLLAWGVVASLPAQKDGGLQLLAAILAGLLLLSCACRAAVAAASCPLPARREK